MYSVSHHTKGKINDGFVESFYFCELGAFCLLNCLLATQLPPPASSTSSQEQRVNITS
jgi:hypothetical protein